MSDQEQGEQTAAQAKEQAHGADTETRPPLQTTAAEAAAAGEKEAPAAGGVYEQEAAEGDVAEPGGRQETAEDF